MARAGGPRPSDILTAEAFANAICALMAIGGSTKAVIHLLALAGRVGVPLSLARVDALSRTTPFLLNVRPSGKYLMEDFFYAGGPPVVLKELLPLVHGAAPTVNGRTLADNVRDVRGWNGDVIRPLGMPLAPPPVRETLKSERTRVAHLWQIPSVKLTRIPHQLLTPRSFSTP
jgi:dihydroxy-acid dehydratase